MTGAVRTRLDTALGSLACWTGWAAFDAHRHDTARHLWTLALEPAVAADEPDLRAHVLADIAAGHNHQADPEDSLYLIRLADGDERTSPAVRAILHGVRAHAYATLGDEGRCHEHLKLTEDLSYAVTPDTVPSWFGGWQPAHTGAVCAHAATTLALVTGSDPHLSDAHDRLARAVDALTSAGRPRALALCQARLAALHLHTGDLKIAAHWLERAGSAATDLRSARVNHALAGLHASLDAAAR
jgi:hypothetical protein